MAESQDRQISLAGHTLTIRYSLKATLALKDAWGLASDNEIEARMQSPGLDDFVTILWAGLRTHHPDVTREDVLDWADDAGLDGIQQAMGDAIDGASIRPKPGGPPKGQRTPRRR